MSFWELGRTALSYFALLFGINFTLKPNAYASLGKFTFYKNFGAINIHKSDFVFVILYLLTLTWFFFFFLIMYIHFYYIHIDFIISAMACLLGKIK